MSKLHLCCARACAAVGIALLAGCQSYTPRPLNHGEHISTWKSRLPSDESVRSFVEQLEQSGDLRASSFDVEDGISLPEAELIALVFHPELRLARLRADVALATADNAGLWDDPGLSFDVLNVIDSVSSPWILSSGLAFTVPVSGRLGVERDRSRASHDAALLRVAESEWLIRYRVRRAWLEWSAANIEVEEQQRLLDSIASLAASTSRLADAGEMSQTEAGLFAIEHSIRANELLALSGMVGAHEQELRSLMGLAPDAPVQLDPTLDPPPLVTEDADASLPESNPTLIRLIREYEVAEHTLKQEVGKQYPDLTVGPLVESDQGQSRIGFLGALPLPLLNANKQGIAEATAMREVARAAVETAHEQLLGSIAHTKSRAATTQQQREQLVTKIVPLVDKQVQTARQLLELGEGGGLVLLESMLRAHETKIRLVEARLNEALLRAELSYLYGPSEPYQHTQQTQTPYSEVNP